MKKFAWRKCRKIVLEAIFSHVFQSFCTKFFVIVLLDIIGLTKFPIVFQQIIIQNYNVYY